MQKVFNYVVHLKKYQSYKKNFNKLFDDLRNPKYVRHCSFYFIDIFYFISYFYIFTIFVLLKNQTSPPDPNKRFY